MNEYAVTYSDGTVVEITAWTAGIAEAIAEEDAEFDGRTDLKVVSVKPLSPQTSSAN